MKNSIFLLALILVFGFFLFGCIGSEVNQYASSGKIRDSEITGYKIYENNDARFSFRFPSDWQIKDRNDVVVYLEGRQASFMVILSDLPGGNYLNIAQDKLKRLRNDTKAFNIESESLLVGGAVARAVVYDTGPQGSESNPKDVLTSEIVYVNDRLNSRLVTILFMTPAPAYTQTSKIVDAEVLPSFIWRKGKN